MALGKAKEPKAPKPPKAPKEKKPKKEKPPKPKKGKKGQPVPAPEGEAQEQGQEQEQGKKKLPLPLLLIPLVVIVAAAAIVIFVVLPRLGGGEGEQEDPEPTVSVVPLPPELPETILVGETAIAGMQLEGDESEALAEKSKLVIYKYTNLVDAGKAAETYVGQLAKESPAFSVVDEEFVRCDRPDFTAAEGMVLLARNIPAAAAPAASKPPETESPAGESGDPGESGSPAPESTPPEGSQPPVNTPTPMVLSVRIEWAPGVCLVTANEEEGQVTSPPSAVRPNHSITQRGARQILEGMDPAQLELSGDSMDEYEVMPVDGTETVDGRPCIRLYVYSDNNRPNTNEFMGSYLMSIDGEHLYKVDPITDEIKELDYTP